jgi:predicted P-loop ATPase
MSTAVDVNAYYRQITDTDIGAIARELLGSRVTQESGNTLLCDCPNHQSQSKKSLHISVDSQKWYCFGCAVGGDVLQLVEFVQSGTITRGQSGRMPDTHRAARDFLAVRAMMPPLGRAGQTPEELAAAEEAHREAIRVREVLTATAEYYHQALVSNPEVLAWFRQKYGISDEMIERLKIGFAVQSSPGVVSHLRKLGFTPADLATSSAFRPTSQDGLMPFFASRIVFPYWSRGYVVFLIGRQTPWTPNNQWETAKYKKLAVRNDNNNRHVSEAVKNDVLFNEDVLLRRPERVIITEGVTDCISLMQHGFPVVSPVTVQIREGDWERLLPKLTGVKTVFICQDNELSEAGIKGALRTAAILSDKGIATRIATLPLGPQQETARRQLTEKFGVRGSVSPKELSTLMAGRDSAAIAEGERLLAAAKIDVNEYFASGKTAADFEAVLEAAQTPLEMSIGALSEETPEGDLSRTLEPVLAEIGRLAPLEQERHLRLVQTRVGKNRAPVVTLRKQLRVVQIDQPRGGKTGRGRNHKGASDDAAPPTPVTDPTKWRDSLLRTPQGAIRPVIANAITALRWAPEWTGVLARNEFALTTVALRPAPIQTTDPQTQIARTWSPADDILTAEWLHHQGIFVSADVTALAVETLASQHHFHPVREYLNSLSWDGTHRLATWLTDYLGAAPTPYNEAVGTRWMISAVARIFEPGCKADCCLILEGDQGIRKSTALRTLGEPWFTDELAEIGSKDAALQTQGVWIVEIAELDSMSRADVGKIKAFMSRATDRFRPPYGKRLVTSPRQCVFAGSVNHGTYLRDETGGRRFWPVACTKAEIDIDALAAVRDQLWAEAYTYYFDGKPWWLDSLTLSRAAAEQQGERYEEDPWDELIANWTEAQETVSITEVLEHCLQKRRDQWTQQDKVRIGRCLRAHGWERFNSGSRSRREWRFRRREG